MAMNEAIAVAAGTRFSDFVMNSKEFIGSRLYNNLREETPVDTGAAQDAWTETNEGGAVVISNEIEYLPNLDRGHSPQAPEGFIQDTIQRTSEEIQPELQQQANTLR